MPVASFEKGLVQQGLGPACGPQFGTERHFGVGGLPNQVQSGDFNSDGRPDLAVANTVSNDVSILINLGSGSFSAPQSIPMGAAVGSLAVADLDGDRNLDLVVVVGASVAVALGDGAGGFGSPSLFPAGTAPFDPVIADFNGDGLPDVALVDSVANGVTVLLGDGGGGLGPPSTYPTGATPYSVGAGDFNGDGHPDLAVANSDDDDVSILFGNGSGGFGPPTNFSVGDRPWAIAVADFNHDDRPDLAVVNITYGVVSILLGDGAGGFSNAPDVSSGATAVAVGDFDGNGDPDLAFTISGGLAAIYLGDGHGGFAAAGNAFSGPSYSLVTADFDGDGKRDVVAADYFDGFVVLLQGDGSGGLGPQTSFPASLRPEEMTMADFNADGWLDAATVDANTGQVNLLLGDGTGHFGPPTSFPSGMAFPYHLVAGDFTGDGIPDVVVSGGISGEAFLTFLPGQGGGLFGPPTILSTAGFGSLGLTAGDFNEDGKLDFAVGGNEIAVFRGNGNGTFQAPTTNPTDHAAYTLSAADLNHDGHLDLVGAILQNFSVAVLLGDGTGGFGAATTYGVGIQPTQVAFADFNEDGNVDLAVSLFSEGGDGVGILYGTGTGTFGPAQRLFYARYGYSVATADFNRDGHSDIALGSFSGFLVINGDGHGTFSLPLYLPLGFQSATAADLNLDGRIDLASINPDLGTLTVLLNTSLDLQPASAPNGSVGVPYAGATFRGVGGVEPYVLSLSGSAPPGLVLDPGSGTLSGTPTQAGVFTFDVVATDHNGCVRSRTLQVTISGGTVQVALSVLPSPLFPGQPVTLRAVITPVPPSPTAPTGTVTFIVDGVAQAPVPVVDGVATLTLPSLGVGVHQISAVYSGDGVFGTAVSAVNSETVLAAAVPGLDWRGAALLAVLLAVAGWRLARVA